MCGPTKAHEQGSIDELPMGWSHTIHIYTHDTQLPPSDFHLSYIPVHSRPNVRCILTTWK